MWLGRLFPPRVLKRFEGKQFIKTSPYRNQIMYIHEDLGRLLQNIDWEGVQKHSEKREVEDKEKTLIGIFQYDPNTLKEEEKKHAHDYLVNFKKLREIPEGHRVIANLLLSDAIV